MRWPWSKPQACAQLRIFADGKAILAMPENTTERTAYDAGERLKQWMDSDGTGLLVLPFPVEIADYRPVDSADKSVGFRQR